MQVQSMVANIVRAVAGVLSFAVSGYGAYSCGWADFRQDALLTALFCILPLLSLPAFFLSFKWFRWSAALQWILAAGYLAVYSLLDWRTCAELGYCRGAAWTVFETLKAPPVEAYFAVAVFNLAALFLHGMRGPARGNARAMTT
jgi:hypothetical protein